MRRGVLKLLGITLMIVCANSAAGDSKDEKARKYLELYGVVDSINRNTDSSMSDIKRHYSHLKPGFWKDERLDRMVETYKTRLFEEYVNVAVNTLTEEELDELFAFLNTDLGKKFLSIDARLRPLYDGAAAKVNSQFMDSLTKLMYEYRP